MRIALAQYAMASEMEPNLDKALNLMKRAAGEGAQLILFPELCLSPFFPQHAAQQVAKYAVGLAHPHVQRLQSACRQFKIAASPNIYLQENCKRFDASLVIASNGAVQGASKMVHIAQLPGFYEQDYYAQSDTGFRVYDMPWGKIGIVVCFDRHIPDSVRTCVMRGAALILIPTANTMAEPRDIFECEIRAAAFQYGTFIAMCNRVGVEGEVSFCGESTVVDPNGNLVKRAGVSEELLIADIDLTETEAARAKRPYLSLRRPEMYGVLAAAVHELNRIVSIH